MCNGLCLDEDFMVVKNRGLAKIIEIMPNDVSKSAPSPDTGSTLNPSARAPGLWNHLTPWTVLGLVVTGGCAGVLVWIERTAAIQELDKLPVLAGALIGYVIVMASGARVAYKRCHRG